MQQREHFTTWTPALSPIAAGGRCGFISPSLPSLNAGRLWHFPRPADIFSPRPAPGTSVRCSRSCGPSGDARCLPGWCRWCWCCCSAAVWCPGELVLGWWLGVCSTFFRGPGNGNNARLQHLVDIPTVILMSSLMNLSAPDWDISIVRLLGGGLFPLPSELENYWTDLQNSNGVR